MKFFKHILSENLEYKEICKDLDMGRTPIGVNGLSGIHKTHLIHSLCENNNKKALVIASDEIEAQRMANDFRVMGSRAVIYPSRDFTFRKVEGKSREYEHQRLKVLSSIINNECDIVISCIDACLQYTLPKKVLQDSTIIIKSGEEIAPDKIITKLIQCGYERSEQVEGSGQFSIRGGILDFFVPSENQPVRIEFWGDEIDSMNYFDIETQRRTSPVEKISISPSTEILITDSNTVINNMVSKLASLKGKYSKTMKENIMQDIEILKSTGTLSNPDKYITLIYDKITTLFDYIDKESYIFFSEQSKIKDRIKSNNYQWSEDLRDYLEEGVLCSGLDTFSEDWIYAIGQAEKHKTIFLDMFAMSGCDMRLKDIFTFNAKQLSSWSGSFKMLLEDIAVSDIKNRVYVVMAGTDKTASIIAKDLIDEGYNAVLIDNDKTTQFSKGKIYVVGGGLSAGMEYPSISFTLISYGMVSKKSKRDIKKSKVNKQIYSLSELSVGDYVVHSTHGIGMFQGIHKIEMQGIVKDYIKIKYAKEDIIYVPVTQLDLVSKYVGPKEDTTVKLSKLGSLEWQKSKARVKNAVKDIAKELIKLYSERMKAPGYAFSPDGEWQRDFELRFEHEETEDQYRSIQEIKHDMERTAPMDRLLCGDVGFGKTEVAMRAAFKCVTDSKQCAILVPTTILAWQHYQTALKRFEGFPVKIEILSRFRTPKQQAEIIKQIKKGEIDLVIGTHRLVQKDVVFKDLGLAIIDEEQRFGVAQKEKFKEFCKNVDVLTLSATPIPRTLNMAMSGIRDMSILEEAPQDRHPVQTYVLEHDRSIINEAIRKELRRGGQVYFLHNRVDTIASRAMQIQADIPEAKVAVGHGQMSENQLSEVWRQLLEQEINVLVCTTIIETGVDVPNANTLIIENADRMGLSQLHQLRGRVGRSTRRAYAYLTFERSKVLSEISQKRLNSIREFTEFGSGFKIAIRDLELRGAGNILGSAQHGHMEDVGYEMYIKMLEEAVREQKGEITQSRELECLVDVQIQAHIPEDYIENLQIRLDIYKKISDIRTGEDALDVTDELIDRFGTPPQSVLGLIDVALVRNTAASLGVYEIKQLKDKINIYVRELNSQGVSIILCNVNGKAVLNPSAQKPFITVNVEEKETPIDTLKRIFKS